MPVFLAVLIILLFVALRFGLPLALSIAGGFIMCRLADWLDRRNQESRERKRQGRQGTE